MYEYKYTCRNTDKAYDACTRTYVRLLWLNLAAVAIVCGVSATVQEPPSDAWKLASPWSPQTSPNLSHPTAARHPLKP